MYCLVRFVQPAQKVLRWQAYNGLNSNSRNCDYFENLIICCGLGRIRDKFRPDELFNG